MAAHTFALVLLIIIAVVGINRIRQTAITIIVTIGRSFSPFSGGVVEGIAKDGLCIGDVVKEGDIVGEGVWLSGAVVGLEVKEGVAVEVGEVGVTVNVGETMVGFVVGVGLGGGLSIMFMAYLAALRTSPFVLSIVVETIRPPSSTPSAYPSLGYGSRDSI